MAQLTLNLPDTIKEEAKIMSKSKKMSMGAFVTSIVARELGYKYVPPKKATWEKVN